MVRDYIVAVCDGNGGGGIGIQGRDEVLPLLGRAVSSMSGERDELSALFGPGFNAAAAEALL